MNLDYSKEDELFREEVTDWLEANKPREVRPGDGPAMRDFDVAWQRKQYEGGWAGIAWPREFGGLGLPLIRQLIWYEQYALADAPPLGVSFVGLAHAGPTLIACGSDAQRAKFLPEILSGDAMWCQGFSEPGAGSDLAGLRTRARIEGDHLVVNGQKIWTSHGHLADRQELLVRTDPEAPKHKGLSWVICDMNYPGVTPRPIKTMAAHSHFCEVFYDDVRIPLDRVVGGLNNGWRVAMSTLSFERGTANIADQVQLARTLDQLIEVTRTTVHWDGRRSLIQDDEVARRLGQLWAEVAALRAMTYATVSRNLRQDTPGAEGSIIRLYYTTLHQRVHRLAMDILGRDSLILSAIEQGWTQPYLYSYAFSIGGGTSEIQRNIIGERFLGLPKE